MSARNPNLPHNILMLFLTSFTESDVYVCNSQGQVDVVETDFQKAFDEIGSTRHFFLFHFYLMDVIYVMDEY